MSEITFQYESLKVRTITFGNEPWFVAKDVCAILGLSDVSMSLSRLDPDEKGTSSIGTPGGTQQLSTINESGLYSLILTSRKPEAKAFKKWITSEVLPSIRRTGSYSLTKDFTGGFTIPKSYSEALRLAADQADTIELLKPKAMFYDTAMNATDWIDMQDVSAIIAKKGFGRNNLIRFLTEKFVFINSLTPYRNQIELGRFKVVETPYQHPKTKETKISRKICASQKGIDFIIRFIVWLTKQIDDTAIEFTLG